MTEGANQLSRRPPLASNLGGIIAAIPALPFMLSGVAASILLIVIMKNSFSHLTAVGKTATVFHFLSLLLSLIPIANTYGPFITIFIDVIYAVAEGRTRPLLNLEVSFIVLSMVGNSVQCLWGILHRFFINRMLYDEWIKSYNFESMKDSKNNLAGKWHQWVIKLTDRVIPMLNPEG